MDIDVRQAQEELDGIIAADVAAARLKASDMPDAPAITEPKRDMNPSGVQVTGSELLDANRILADQVGITHGQNVADLGCGGHGHFTLMAARLVGDKGQVYAADILKTVLYSVDAKANYQGLYNVKTVWTNLEEYGATDIPEGSLDHALLLNTLFMSKRHPQMMREAYRLVKRGGHLGVVDWKKSSGPIGPAQEDRVDPRRITEIASGLGFREVKNFEAGPNHWGLVFQKA